MDRFLSLLVAHQWAAAASIVVLALYTLLSDRTRGLTWDSPWRPLLATVFGVLGPVLDAVAHGAATASVLVSALITAAPTLYAEIVLLLHPANATPPAGTVAASRVATASTVVFAALTMALAASGCQYAQHGCQVIHVADQLCPLVTFELPDGGCYVVSKGELERAAARTSEALDAGADK